MKLSKLEITNFRCFETLAVTLQPDVNVFVGVNGAGKTAILDAIAIALNDVVAANGGGGKRQRRSQSVMLRPSDIHLTPGKGDPVSRRKDFVQFRATAQDFYEVGDYPSKTPTGDAAAIEWTDHIRFQPPGGFIYDTSQSRNLSRIYGYFRALWQEARKSDKKALIPFPVVAYYRATRRVSEMPPLGDIFKLTLERHGAFENALDAGANYQAMCQWLYLRENHELREKIRAKNAPHHELADLRAIRRALSLTLEGVERVFFEENPPKLRAELRRTESSMEVLELEQLSDGYRNLLAVVLDFARRLAQAHPNWENPLDAPGILLIDEIELHLHPRWQQTVIPSLQSAFPNTQLIVATHSPAVLTTVRRENIHLLGSDHAFEHIASDVGTYGAESSRVLQEVFAVDTRPPEIETTRDLTEYLRLVEAQDQDSDRGRELRAKLERALGKSDPDLLHADARISQLKALKAT